jgi:hypothetical protein
MKQPLRLLVAPLALVLGAGSAAVIGTGPSSRAPLYTVAQARAGLVHDPRAWLGHTLWLRGVVTEPCSILASQAAYSYCASREQPVLLDTESLGAAPPQPRVALRLAWAGLDPLLTVVRRAPLAGRFAPAPQVVHWGVVATYRVRLRTMSDGQHSAALCYEAAVLDAAP